VSPLDRQPQPEFWAAREERFRKGDQSAKKALHGFQHKLRSLADWFHEKVRPDGAALLCAYCDGPLEETSPKTIDHFIPEHADRGLGLTWTNLYPACVCCNSTFKGTRWSCNLVRPDRNPVERWFVFDLDTGRVNPAPELDRRTRAQVRLTTRVFQLNTEGRCMARKRVWRAMENAAKHPQDSASLEDYAAHGPYRFVAALFLSMREGPVAES
jgi:uncharacterized protein (TIGR02646 family)